jgi:hypothetical protein
MPNAHTIYATKWKLIPKLRAAQQRPVSVSILSGIFPLVEIIGVLGRPINFQEPRSS